MYALMTEYLFYSFIYFAAGSHRDLNSFPTRRSSDLLAKTGVLFCVDPWPDVRGQPNPCWQIWLSDRKSTRLNSSHGSISYAVFCLQKKIVRRIVSVKSILYHLIDEPSVDAFINVRQI